MREKDKGRERKKEIVREKELSGERMRVNELSDWCTFCHFHTARSHRVYNSVLMQIRLT